MATGERDRERARERERERERENCGASDAPGGTGGNKQKVSCQLRYFEQETGAGELGGVVAS